MLSVEIGKQFGSPGSSNFQLQINDEFPSGFTVLFGPSGAGKSTILDCIAGLQLPDIGRITLGDELFFDGVQKIVMPPQRRRIAYVFQSLALFPHLSVEENVSYGISPGTGEECQLAIERALNAFHIAELRRRKPRELSGGEQQRVALARSLATVPRLLLLDEPLTGLDAGLRSTILQDLREWNASRQIPILYVTHNREELDAIGERVIVLERGKVVGRGVPSAVLDSPVKLAIAQATGFENLLSATVVKSRPEDGVMDVMLFPSDKRLEVPLAHRQSGDQVRVAIRAGDILVAMEIPRSISARNILPGSVESLGARGTLVALQVNAGVRFVVHITPAAVRDLSILPGTQVWLIVKTHSCHVVD
jgi:molybdate transport system ATP-binding protein